MKIEKIKIVCAIAAFVGLFVFGQIVRAQETPEQKQQRLNNEIQQYQNEITRLQTQANTLSNQIAQYDAQIKLTTLKIAQVEEKISHLGTRIDQLESSLTALTDAFSTRAKETYKMVRMGEVFYLLITAPDLNEAVIRYHYLQKIQEADRSLLIKLQEAQTGYQIEKESQEDLQSTLEDEKVRLSNQKAAKANLLNITKNDEKRYQALLNQALAEKTAIEQALISGVKVGPIKRGDPIAIVGNSGYPGCSTGKHLHFEIRKNNVWVDPAGYLSNKTVLDEQGGKGAVNIGSGSWPWPIEDTIRLTQFYGHTPYSWRYTYSGGIHTGFDMVSTSSDMIKAPADGTLYKSSQLCGSSTINIVYIEHGDGVISFYLHVN